MAVDRLETATTNMTQADLSHLDLTKIRLEGLRWSSQTRWPPGWQAKIRRHSVKLAPGLYEIRYGGVDINQTIDTSI